MLTTLELFKVAHAGMTGLSGTVISFLVLAFYSSQWKKNNNSGDCDQIHISMAIINVLLQGFLSLDGILDGLQKFLNLGNNIILAEISLQLALFNVSAWNTAWLSIFYCVRLVTFSHPYLLKMKATFLSSVPRLIVGSLLGSIIINLPFLWLTEIIPNQNTTLVIFAYDISLDVNYTMFSSFFGLCVPFILTCLGIGQCVTSLLRHVWRTNLSESLLTSSQLRGHIRAARTMTMRLVLDLTFYILYFVGFVTSFQIHDILSLCCWAIVLIYPTAHSLILVHGNPKLKREICGKFTLN